MRASYCSYLGLGHRFRLASSGREPSQEPVTAVYNVRLSLSFDGVGSPFATWTPREGSFNRRRRFKAHGSVFKT